MPASPSDLAQGLEQILPSLAEDDFLSHLEACPRRSRYSTPVWFFFFFFFLFVQSLLICPLQDTSDPPLETRRMLSPALCRARRPPHRSATLAVGNEGVEGAYGIEYATTQAITAVGGRLALQNLLLPSQADVQRWKYRASSDKDRQRQPNK